MNIAKGNHELIVSLMNSVRRREIAAMLNINPKALNTYMSIVGLRDDPRIRSSRVRAYRSQGLPVNEITKLMGYGRSTIIKLLKSSE
jgi:hypothetical protein